MAVAVVVVVGGPSQKKRFESQTLLAFALGLKNQPKEKKGERERERGRERGTSIPRADCHCYLLGRIPFLIFGHIHHTHPSLFFNSLSLSLSLSLRFQTT